MEKRRLALILSHLRPRPRTHQHPNPHCNCNCNGNGQIAAAAGGSSASPNKCSHELIGSSTNTTTSSSSSSSDATDSAVAAAASGNEVTTESCIFCDIIHGCAPAVKLYEDEICLCILDVNPLTRGHSLVIPKRHFSSLEVTPPSVAAAMCSIIPMISSAIMEATNCDSFNLLVNNGAAAGQVIFHTHFHIIPRQVHDKLWRSEDVRRGRLYPNEEASSLAEFIRVKLKSRK